jgi:hypothetical protein
VYLSAPAKCILAEYKLHVTDDDLGVEYVQLLGYKYRTEETPEGHAPANIVGLKTLFRWGLSLHAKPFRFSLAQDFAYLET